MFTAWGEGESSPHKGGPGWEVAADILVLVVSIMSWLIGIGATIGITTLGLIARSVFKTKGPVFIVNRVIQGPGGFRYFITDEDVLWLARAVWGEAGTNTRNGAGVLWSMAQYHALVEKPDGTRPKFSTLTSLLRSYCQPINPSWDQASDANCQRNPSHCTASHLSRRRQMATASWDSIPSSIRSLVSAFVSGRLSNPVPGATDWAAYNWQSRSATPLIDIGGNKFGVGIDRRIYRGV